MPEETLRMLKKTASILATESDSFKVALAKNLQAGLSYPKARENALNENICGDSSNDNGYISKPNNILAIEYLKAIERTHSKIVPHIVKRTKSEYNSLEFIGNHASATAIRSAILENNTTKLEKVMPETSFNILKQSINNGTAPVFYDNFSQLLLYKIRSSTPNQLASFLDVDEGIENRIIKFASQSPTISELVSQIKTKRYTFTKIQRTLLHILLSIEKSNFENYYGTVPYIRVLGFRNNSQSLLTALSANCSAPLIFNVKGSLSKETMPLISPDFTATDIYMLGRPSAQTRNAFQDFTVPLVKV